jgi:hypothetical protein
VHILKETTKDSAGDGQLFYQWCRFESDEYGTQFGYRFIWRQPGGNLQAARGQARIPSAAAAKALIDKAEEEGWGDRDGDQIQAASKRLEDCGFVVFLDSGYAGWPTKEAAINGQWTQQNIEDAQLLRRWI